MKKQTSNVENSGSSWATASFNVEENSDLDTSNESYISDSEEVSDGEEEENKNLSQHDKTLKESCKVLSREAKALVGRRFSKYFDRIGVLPENYWRQSHQEYQRSRWIKLTFDGRTKRYGQKKPKQLEDLLELVKKRFGVLKYILQTGQFKPLMYFKSVKMACNIQIETSTDLTEMFDLVEMS